MLEIILVEGFCPLKIKITRFPHGLVGATQFEGNASMSVQFPVCK